MKSLIIGVLAGTAVGFAIVMTLSALGIIVTASTSVLIGFACGAVMTWLVKGVL